MLLTSFETALDQAAAAHPNPGRIDTFRRLNRTEYRNSIRELNSRRNHHALHVSSRREYDVQLRLQRDRNEHVEVLKGPEEVELAIDGERIKFFTVKPPAKGDDHHLVHKDLNVRFAVKGGPHLVSVSFVKAPSVLLETERQPYKAHFNMDRHPRIHTALFTISVNGPYGVTGSGDTSSRKRIFVCEPSRPDQEDACANRILMALMWRAYRRPVTASDLSAPLRFYREARPFTEGSSR